MPLALEGSLLGVLAAAGVLLLLSTVDRSRVVGRRPGRLRSMVAASGIAGLAVPRLLLACGLASVTAGLLALAVTGLPAVGAAGAGAGALLPVSVVGRRAQRCRNVRRAAWPDAVDGIVAAVRAGLALPDATATLAVRGPDPLRGDFTAFAVEHRATGSLGQALDVLERRLADPVGDRVVAALRLAGAAGGTDLGTMLRSLSGMLREDARIRAEIEARQSWTVAAARMAVAAPWLTLALLCTRPEVVEAYASPVGAAIIVTTAVVCAVAYLLMVRIGRLPADERSGA